MKDDSGRLFHASKSELLIQRTSIINVAPQIAPTIAARGAVRSADCDQALDPVSASKIAASVIREAATTYGLRETTHRTIAVTK